jgi:hypothetical protein
MDQKVVAQNRSLKAAGEAPRSSIAIAEDMTSLTSLFPQPEVVRQDVQRDGFKVYPGAISSTQLKMLREFWLPHFANPKTTRKVVRGDLTFGEVNFNSYSQTSFWNLYRDFDFLWNPSTHGLTREISIQIHEQRNRIEQNAPYTGLHLNPERYGIYISTSCYPTGKGFLQAHSDGHKNTPILHYMLAITHRDVDYESGGFFILDKNDKKIDVEAQVTPGSIIFFDGRIRHGVDLIQGGPGSPGRIATFAIPTFFVLPSEVPKGMAAAAVQLRTWLRSFKQSPGYK